MAQNYKLSEIIKFGLDNKKRPEEMLSAGLSAGFTSAQIGAELEQLKKVGALDYVNENKGAGSVSTKGGKQLGAEQVSSIAEGDVALNSLDTLEKTLSERKDIGGPIAGRIYTAGEERGALQSEFNSAVKVVGGFLEGGKLAGEDQKVYEEILPNMADSAEERRKKIENLKKQVAERKKILIDTYSSTGFDVSGFGEKTQENLEEQQIDPEQVKSQLAEALKSAKANPDNPKAQEFIKNLRAGNYDINTGKLKEEAREKTEEEKEIDEIYGKKETEQKEEEKGFFGNFGADIQSEKNLKSLTKSAEEQGKVVEELGKKYFSLKENLKNSTGEERANLEKQVKETFTEWNNQSKILRETAEKIGNEDIKIEERKAGANKTFGGALYEGAQDVADLGRDTMGNLKETGEELVGRGKGIIEAGGRLAKGEQGLGSTALQMAGEVGGGVSDVIELGGKQFIDTLKAGGKVLLPQGAEDYLGEKGKEEVNNVIQSVTNTETGRKALGWFMEKGKEWEQYKSENPVEAKNIEAVGKITEGVLAMAGLSKAKKVSGAVGSKLTQGAENLGEKAVSLGGKTGEILKGTGQKVGDVASGVGGKVKGVFKAGEKSIPEGTILEGQKGAELLDKLKPKFTPTQTKKLTKDGRFFKEEKGKIKGFLEGKGKDVYSYSQYDKDVANSVADALGGVKKVEKMDKNEIVRNLRDKIKVTSETLKPELEKVSIDPKKMGNIKDEWKIIKQTQAQDPNFSSANGKKLHKDFETFIDKVGVIKGNKLQSADELWNLAKKYDDLYPNIANYVGDDPKRLLQKEMWNENRTILRNTINNAVENSNASKETKEAFKKMSHYYRAIDNIGTQTLEKGTEGVKGQIKESIKGKVVAGTASLVGAGYLGSKF